MEYIIFGLIMVLFLYISQIEDKIDDLTELIENNKHE